MHVFKSEVLKNPVLIESVITDTERPTLLVYPLYHKNMSEVKFKNLSTYAQNKLDQFYVEVTTKGNCSLFCCSISSYRSEHISFNPVCNGNKDVWCISFPMENVTL